MKIASVLCIALMLLSCTTGFSLTMQPSQAYRPLFCTGSCFSYSFLARMILETESGLDGVEKRFMEKSVTGGHGMIWSDRKQNQARLIEVINDRTAMTEIKESLFNRKSIRLLSKKLPQLITICLIVIWINWKPTWSRLTGHWFHHISA